MKRLICLTILLFVLPFSAHTEQTSLRKMTVMVYMCGSNLESSMGAASADFQEMLDSGYGSEACSLLVMAGGTEAFQRFGTAETAIYEIRAGRQRRVWPAQAGSSWNMGDRDTIVQLLRFARDRYPAEHYALIFWNHGGGPLEGVCWDELYSMDQLTLEEVTGALAEAELGQKLSWIGFDACLMASLEVAQALSPYAEFMIASQETEPAWGWDYAFLQELTPDMDGAGTGRMIVDAYIRDREDVRETLTLSCVDLSMLQDILLEMNGFFSPLRATMDPESFLFLSGQRLEATDFGQGVKGLGGTGYDLVDLKDLVTHLDTDGRGAALTEAIDRAVVYSRANSEGANGLSVYHPYANKEKYLDKWRKDYSRLGFCPPYISYTDTFGAYLTVDPGTDWSGLVPDLLSAEGEVNQVCLQLTPDQAAHFASAQLLVLAGGFNTFGEIDDCLLVAACPASMDSRGRLTGSYSGRTLYAVEESGRRRGPISFSRTDDGQYNAVKAVYTPLGRDTLQDAAEALHFLDAAGPDGPFRPAFVQVYDEALQTYTGRLSLNEADFRLVNLWNFFCRVPSPVANGALPAFRFWPVNTGSMGSPGLSLPQNWHYQYEDGFQSGEQYFAVFEITDLNQNMLCSQPVMLNNPNLTRISLSTQDSLPDRLTLLLDGYLDTSPTDPGLQLFVSVSSPNGSLNDLSISDIVLNGSRQTDCIFSPYEAGGSVLHDRLDIPASGLTGLGTLTSVSMTVRLHGSADAGIPLTFLVEETDLIPFEPAPEPLAEASLGKVSWSLLSVSAEQEDRVDLLFRVLNDSDQPFSWSGDAAVSGLHLKSTANSVQLPAGMDRILSFSLDNTLARDYFSGITVADDHSIYSDILEENLLAAAGIHSVEEIILFPLGDWDAWMPFVDSTGLDDTRLSFRLSRPYTLLGSSSDAEVASLSLCADPGKWSLACSGAFAGDNGLIVCLKAENRLDHPLYVRADNFSVNGRPAEAGGFPGDSFLVYTQCDRFFTVALKTDEAFSPEERIREFSFSISVDGEPSRLLRFVLTEPADPAAPDGTVIPAKSLAVQAD